MKITLLFAMHTRLLRPEALTGNFALFAVTPQWSDLGTHSWLRLAVFNQLKIGHSLDKITCTKQIY